MHLGDLVLMASDLPQKALGCPLALSHLLVETPYVAAEVIDFGALPGDQQALFLDVCLERPDRSFLIIEVLVLRADLQVSRLELRLKGRNLL